MSTTQVAFTQMKDGTKAEYEFLHGLEAQYIARRPTGSSRASVASAAGSRAIRSAGTSTRCRAPHGPRPTAPTSR